MEFAVASRFLCGCDVLGWFVICVYFAGSVGRFERNLMLGLTDV